MFNPLLELPDLFQSGMNAIFNAHRLSSNLCLARENPTAPPESLTDLERVRLRNALFSSPEVLALLHHLQIRIDEDDDG